MDDGEPPRSPPQSPRGRSSMQNDSRRDPGPEDMMSPRRRAYTDLSQVPTINIDPSQSIRRRNTSNRRESALGLRRSATRASRVSGRSNFSLSGPEDTSALRAQHAPFVHPAYAELNPAYEQPANTKPVWSLAKPLPRVVRPGMVPTVSEAQEIQNQLPGEHTANEGLKVDPSELEKGRVQPTADPSKISAQLKDARAQREHNFLQRLRGGTTTRASSRMQSISQMESRTSSRRRRTSTWEPEDMMSAPPRRSEGGEHLPEGHHNLDPIPEGAQEEPYIPDGLADDAASLTTLGAEDDKEGLEALVENIIEDEVHNHHTTWSVIRTMYREPLAEMLGVIVQLTVGFCSDLAVTCAASGNSNTTDFAWGFATMSAIYVSGGISGAHLNPAITIMLYVYRGFPKRMIPQYLIAQFLGAFIAAFIAYGLYYASIQEYLSLATTTDTSGIVTSFITSQRYDYINAVTAFFNEFFGTVILTVIVLALGDDSNAPPGAGMNALIIGFVVTMNSMAFAFQTGSALNPSRDFGPRLALLCLGYGSELFTNPYWFYGPIAGSLLGAMIGAALYDAAIFTGGESPINYPWTRTKRAARKSKMRWAWRLKGDKEEGSEHPNIIR